MCVGIVKIIATTNIQTICVSYEHCIIVRQIIQKLIRTEPTTLLFASTLRIVIQALFHI